MKTEEGLIKQETLTRLTNTTNIGTYSKVFTDNACLGIHFHDIMRLVTIFGQTAISWIDDRVNPVNKNHTRSIERTVSRYNAPPLVIT